MLDHHFAVDLRWTGDRGVGTTSYRSYGRDAVLSAPGKDPIAGSAARAFHGDADRWNPEELLLAALAECHLLSYLYVAAAAGVVVVGYEDAATCTLERTDDGGGRITAATLSPRVTVRDPETVERAVELHAEAARSCFVAASVAFPVHHAPTTLVA